MLDTSTVMSIPDIKRRIGVIGFGSLGRYLISNILQRDDVELDFVWNRNQSALKGHVDDACILKSLDHVSERQVDLVVEVAHPDITAKYGPDILQVCDYMIGSPTALAQSSLEQLMKLSAKSHGLYVPSGAFWGSEDIRKMADRGNLQSLHVTMTFHPESLKITGYLKAKNDAITERTVLYQGAVRELCHLAPNNVNTMAAAALAAHNLGFDNVSGCLISDPTVRDWHIVEIDVHGVPVKDSGHSFHVHTVRRNPSVSGQITGSATLASFLSSMLRATGKGPGIHLC